MIRAGLIGLAMLVLAGDVSAEIPQDVIKAYNTAASSGDAGLISDAAKQLGHAAIKHAGHENAGSYAFEAGWKLCQLGDCIAAKPFAVFASNEPSSAVYPTPADRALLVAYSGWKVKSDRKTRAALDLALQDVIGAAPNQLSVFAFQDRYVRDLAKNNRKSLIQSTGDAAQHFEPAKDVLGPVWANAALASQSTKFSLDHDPDTVRELANLEADLFLIRHFNPKAPEWVKTTEYQVRAWRAAISAYFASEKKHKDLIEQANSLVADARENHTHPKGPELVHDETTPKCVGDFDRLPKPDYPNSALNNGYVGAVIVVVDINDGVVENERIAASVPGDAFDKAVLKSMRPLKWKFADEQPIADCSRSFVIEYPFEFVIR